MLAVMKMIVFLLIRKSIDEEKKKKVRERKRCGGAERWPLHLRVRTHLVSMVGRPPVCLDLTGNECVLS